MPPSTAISAPWTYRRLVGDQPRHSIGDLLGRPRTPSRVSERHRGDDVAVAGVDRRPGRTGGDGVDAHPAGPELCGPAAGELDLGGLGRGVQADDGVPDVGHPRPDDDDRPVAGSAIAGARAAVRTWGARMFTARVASRSASVRDTVSTGGHRAALCTIASSRPPAASVTAAAKSRRTSGSAARSEDEDGLRVSETATPSPAAGCRSISVRRRRGRVATGDDHAPALGGEGAGGRGADAAGGAGDEDGAGPLGSGCSCVRVHPGRRPRTRVRRRLVTA